MVFGGLFGLSFYANYVLHNSSTVPVVNTGSGNSGSGIAVNPETGAVYTTGCKDVTNSSGTTVCMYSLFVLDASSNSMATALPVNEAEGVAVDQSTGMVYVGSHGSGVVVVNGATDSVVASVPGGGDFVAVDPATGLVYSTAYNYQTGSSGLTVIDGATNQAVATMLTGTYSGAGAVAVDPATGMVYVAGAVGYDWGTGNSTSQIYVINGATGTLVRNITVSETDNSVATSIAIDPSTDSIFVATWGQSSGDVAVISGATNLVVANVRLPSGSYGVAADPQSGTVYASGVGGTVSVISEASDSVVSTITINSNGNSGALPGALAFDSSTDTLYVCNTGAGYVSVIKGAPTA